MICNPTLIVVTQAQHRFVDVADQNHWAWQMAVELLFPTLHRGFDALTRVKLFAGAYKNGQQRIGCKEVFEQILADKSCTAGQQYVGAVIFFVRLRSRFHRCALGSTRLFFLEV